MEIAGKLIQKLDQQSGQSKNGTWVKQEFILETQDQYPKKVCVAVWGDKVKDIENLAIGESLKVSINVESREFNGRWYTDVKAWRIETMGSNPTNSSNAPETPSFDEIPPEMPMTQEGDMDDLPF
ncbi:MAG: DUF3127 domain-containing protein [Bacteroidales bacterium]|jgi:hypothetical protein|nr:DUF3127 domain-containing protein [Bacteroidales bacterium]MDD4386043.1 DUF3127 domain-containing protein [Bacteroidales bacterium]MDY0196938.1 DUF3127 domain-containing protein [Tenuifilaceae bacterium]